MNADRCRRFVRFAMLCGPAALMAQPVLAQPVLSDLKGRWVLATPRPGHLGFVMEVTGTEVALAETVRSGLAQCVLTATANQTGKSASVTFSRFVARCGGDRLFLPDGDCTFTVAAVPGTVNVVCVKNKKVEPAVALRRPS